jgi:hypothetical protein
VTGSRSPSQSPASATVSVRQHRSDQTFGCVSTAVGRRADLPWAGIDRLVVTALHRAPGPGCKRGFAFPIRSLAPATRLSAREAPMGGSAPHASRQQIRRRCPQLMRNRALRAAANSGPPAGTQQRGSCEKRAPSALAPETRREQDFQGRSAMDWTTGAGTAGAEGVRRGGGTRSARYICHGRPCRSLARRRARRCDAPSLAFVFACPFLKRKQLWKVN